MLHSCGRPGLSSPSFPPCVRLVLATDSSFSSVQFPDLTWSVPVVLVSRAHACVRLLAICSVALLSVVLPGLAWSVLDVFVSRVHVCVRYVRHTRPPCSAVHELTWSVLVSCTPGSLLGSTRSSSGRTVARPALLTTSLPHSCVQSPSVTASFCAR